MYYNIIVIKKYNTKLRKKEVFNMIGLVNMYGYDKHELVDKVGDNFEYAGTDIFKGVTYDCYLVPDGIVYKAVCVKVG